MPRELTPIPKRKDFHYFVDISTRWMDNDAYGHINNVVYYSYFDTIVNTFLIEHANFDITHSANIGLIVNSQCHYHSGIAFPDKISGGFAVRNIGNSSVTYELAIFKEGSEDASAHGSMTHVFVQRETNEPTPIAGKLKEALCKALKAQ